MHLPLLIATVLIGAPCARPLDRIAFADPGPSVSIREIYETTSRLPSTDPVDNRRDRNAQVNSARFDVSIPPTHRSGKIDWPDDTVGQGWDFAVVGQTDLGSNDAFIQTIRRLPEDKVTVFFQVYNSTSSEALYRYAQVRHAFLIDAPLVLFARPSANQPGSHGHDRNSVLFSRAPIANLLTDIGRRTNKEVKPINWHLSDGGKLNLSQFTAGTGRIIRAKPPNPS